MPNHLSYQQFARRSFHIGLCLLIMSSSNFNLFAAVQTAPITDEAKIAEDRDKAIADAVGNFSKKANGEIKSKKIELKGGEKKSGSWDWSKIFFWEKGGETKAEVKPAPRTSQKAEVKVEPVASAKSEAKPDVKAEVKPDVKLAAQEKPKKRVSASKFFSKPEESPNFEEVNRRRTKRQMQFPQLDPNTIKEAITETKVEMKKEFISVGEHNMEDAIGRAIAVHLPAQIAHERVVLSERRILKAFRDFLPSADLTTTHKDGTLSTGAYKHDDWRVNFRQPLFKGGVLWNTFQMEMANRDAAKHELDSTVNQIVADTAKAYLEYERAWNVIKDKQKLLDTGKRLKDLSDQKEKAKLISEIEKLNMDSLYGQVEYDMETAKQDLELARLELQKVLELDISDPIEIKSMMVIDNVSFPDAPEVNVSAKSDDAKEIQTSSLSVEGKDLQHFIDMAYVYRPDLQVEASKLRAARLSHKISAGKHLPEADMIIEFGKLGEAFEGTDRRFQGDLETVEPRLKTEWRIGAELSWKLGGNTLGYTFDHDQRAPSISQFEGGQGPITTSKTMTLSVLDNLNSLADLKETKIAALEQVVQLEKTERDALREIKEAYFNYNKALIQAESVNKKMKYRERLSKLAEHRHANNEVQVSEYLQAEIDYNEERAALHKAMADYYLAKVNLNRSIGIRDYLKIEGHQFENRN